MRAHAPTPGRIDAATATTSRALSADTTRAAVALGVVAVDTLSRVSTGASDRARSLRVARMVDRTSVLGPGTRAAIWVQGCPLSCAGCLAPEALAFGGGTLVDVDDLATRILGLVPTVDGVTYSGGEPFAHAGALLTLSARLRAAHPRMSLMSFSGFTREWILRRGDAAQRDLLGHLDILIDGPYVASRHAALRWRGSSNQRLHLLSDRHSLTELGADESAGVEIDIRPDASIAFVGVPPVAGFRDVIAASIHDAGLVLT